MDPLIKQALDRADVIRHVYRTVSTVEHPADWLPVSVLCESCGRSGTTIANHWDGSVVAYECRPDLVEWARGCGHRGSVSPFGGRAKLVWNVEWAARWSVLGVTIEGCGKDLATAGGSRDRADAISRQVFEREPPLNVPYEFLNIAGRKMSTSKGQGAAAHHMAEVLPPTILRFLFLRPRPNRAIEFDPSGDTIPRLFDEFDRIADAVAGRPTKGELPPEPERIFALSLTETNVDISAVAARYRPPFAHLALLLQVPGPDILDRLADELGRPLAEDERSLVTQRVAAARAWLEHFAPPEAKLAVHYEDLPAAVAELNDAQRSFLAALADVAEASAPTGGEAWQSAIFATARDSGLRPGDAFGAIYRAFLDRANGPRAGWLLASLGPAFVIGRLRQAAGDRGGGVG